MGALRRSVRASSIESSTSIEGYSVSPADAVSLTSGEASVDTGDDENRLAVACYARAMDHVAAMARGPAFAGRPRHPRSAFRRLLSSSRTRPGLWRTGPIGVTGADGSLEYQAPDAEQVPGLMAEVVDGCRTATSTYMWSSGPRWRTCTSPRCTRSATATAACRASCSRWSWPGRLISPEFLSIEEHLGEHTSAYYAALREAQGGSYQPERDASKWVAFCVEAHLAQARQRLAQIKEAGRAGSAWKRSSAAAAGRSGS